jgi:hypothetical protein
VQHVFVADPVLACAVRDLHLDKVALSASPVKAALSTAVAMIVPSRTRPKVFAGRSTYGASVQIGVAGSVLKFGWGQGRIWRRITQRHLAILRSRLNPNSSNRLSGPVWK